MRTEPNHDIARGFSVARRRPTEAAPADLTRGIATSALALMFLTWALSASCAAGPPVTAKAQPMTPSPPTALQLVGATIFVREGCHSCHGVPAPWFPPAEPLERPAARPLLFPFPERSLEWHFRHFTEPRGVVPNSVMPAYPFLADEVVSADLVDSVGTAETQNGTDVLSRGWNLEAYEAEARRVVSLLREVGIELSWDRELVPLLGLTRGRANQ